MRTIQLLLGAMMLISSYIANCQPKREIRKAEKRFEKSAFEEARVMFMDLANQGYRSPDVLGKIGDSYYYEGDMGNALEWYAELITKYSDYHNDYLFRYAQSLKSLELYNRSMEAIREFYLRKGADPGLVLKRDKEGYLKLIGKQSDRFSIEPYGNNSAYTDLVSNFSPYGGLMFSSDRYSAPLYRVNPSSQTSFDIYDATAGEHNKITEVINTKLHESSLVYSKDQNTVYFTRSYKGEDQNAQAILGMPNMALYKANLEGGQWTNIKKLPFNSKKYSVSHPALSSDGNTLFFASNMPGSKGKWDIFSVAIKHDGSLGEPVNLGNAINTLGNETSPFVAGNGDLYFSSDTHFGLGGFDVFVSRYENGEYQEPVNLGKPVNSMQNDVSFIINDTTKVAYFSSDRKVDDDRKSDYNIYECKQKQNFIFDCDLLVRGRVTDPVTKKGIPSCEVRLFDEEFNEVDSTFTDDNGYYKLSLLCSDTQLIQVGKPNYYLTEKIIHNNGIAKRDVSLPIKLTKGKGLLTANVYAGEGFDNLIELSDIYFDLDASKIRHKEAKEIDKVISVLKQNPGFNIKIRSYTDSRGSEVYNKKLSNRRAIATKNYLVNKGHIAADRISTEGLGQSRAITHCGGNCTEIENQLNRRSEFVILR
ncbi:OmpA family protein [Fulvivirga sediminis]|uniref:OmpA family protein n=1 Tax=Fulvivirga sediminis TaxID=2803949 RepID=A0A937F8I8_9BACT|nr:OmpA family protein [Fulvivirga sediminis]MBL3657680.1 OmpA family protein [Fulvivirga sediminis]